MFFICQLSFIRIKIIFFYSSYKKLLCIYKKKEKVCVLPLFVSLSSIAIYTQSLKTKEETNFFQISKVFFFVKDNSFVLLCFMRKIPMII
jgi:hypothetical protein